MLSTKSKLRNPLKNSLPHLSQDTGVNDKQMPNAMKVEKQIKVLIILKFFSLNILPLEQKNREYRTKYKNYFSWIALLYKGNEKWYKLQGLQELYYM